MFEIQNKKLPRKKNKQKGSIVVLGLLICTGIVVISSEFALFVASALRQARTIDSSNLAYYAAESGVEHALYQVRKQGVDMLTMEEETTQNSSWSFLNDSGSGVDTAKFKNGTELLEKQYFEKDQSIELPLYQTLSSGALSGIPRLKAIKISWDGTVCDRVDPACSGASCQTQTPWIETTVVNLSSNGPSDSVTVHEDQKDNQQVKKDFRAVVSGSVASVSKSVVIPLCDNNPQFSGVCQSSQANPLIVRIKPYFCDLRKAQFTVHSDSTAPPTSVLTIPQYYMINPTGKFGGVTSSVRAYIPQKDIHSGLFDFSLFSEEKVCKSVDKDNPTLCD